MDFFQTNLGIFLTILGQTLLVLGFVMISLLLLVYGDRKIWGAVQIMIRYGILKCGFT